MSRYQECPFCWEEVDLYDYWSVHMPYLGQYITECPGCHRKFDVSIDASFDDGMWRDCSTISPLKALPWPKTITPRELANTIIALKQKYPTHFP
jgi:hypothetical protein